MSGGDTSPRRYFVGAATLSYPGNADLADRPELAGALSEMAQLFTGYLKYEAVAGFGPDLPADQLRDRLRAFLTDPGRRETDVVAFYYTGHGVIDHDDFVLPLADATDDLTGSGVWASQLANWLLRGTVVKRMLIVLDTCHAAAGAAAIAAEGVGGLRRLSGIAETQNVAVVAAARPNDQAGSCAFTRAFVEAVQHRSSGGAEPRFLPLDSIVNKTRHATELWQHAHLYYSGDGISDFLPNPRYSQQLRGLDLRAQYDEEQRRLREGEMESHVWPRAQGLDQPVEGKWLFTGRHEALGTLCGWLRDTTGGGWVRVVTGDPGSGKSALLARLFVLGDRRLRARIPGLDLEPATALPPDGAVARFVHARGLPVDDVMAGLCEATHTDAGTAGELLVQLQDRDRPTTVIVDAVDEATDPDQLVSRLLLPLARGARHSTLRLVIGTRRHLLEALGKPSDVVDLDTEAYADPDSVRAYSRRCLLELVESTPYRQAGEQLTTGVAEAVADAAGRSFLVALIAARSLALRATTADPADARWRAGLPREAADAMRKDIDQRLGKDAGRVRDLLTPLAYALGTGLPWEDLWAPLASALSGADYRDADLDWLVTQAGFYVIEASEDRRSTYRLYHEALAEHLREGYDDIEAQRRFVGALLAVGRIRDDLPYADRVDRWRRAHPYVRTHFATHAERAGVLDEYLVDPAYLLSAARTQLVAASRSAAGLQARAAAAAVQQTGAGLLDLLLAAHQHRADTLIRNITAAGIPGSWIPRWSWWRPNQPHRVLFRAPDRIRAVVAQPAGAGQGAVLVFSGASAQLWDVGTGTPVGLPHSLRPVTAAGIADVAGRPVVMTGDESGNLCTVDVASGAVLKAVHLHSAPVGAVALGIDEGRLVTVSGDDQGTLRLAVGLDGVPTRTGVLGAFPGPVHGCLISSVRRRPVAVTSHGDGTVRFWDLTTGAPLNWDKERQASFIGSPTRNKYPVVLAFGESSAGALGLSEFEVQLLGHARSGQPLCLAPVGDAEPVVAIGTSAGHIHLWQMDSGRMIGQWNTQQGAVNAMTVADRVLCTAGADGTVRVWDPLAGRALGQPWRGHAGPIRAITVVADAGRPAVVTGGEDGTVRVWDLVGASPIGQPWTGHRRAVTALAAVQDREPVAISAAADGTLRSWDLATGVPLGDPWAGDGSAVRCAATGVSRGAAIALTGHTDGTLRVWDAGSGRPAGEPWAHPGEVRCAAIGVLGGDTVAVTGGGGGVVRVWDLDARTQRAELAGGHRGVVLALALIEARGTLLAVSVSTDERVCVWDVGRRALAAGPLPVPGWLTSVAAVTVAGRPVAVVGSDRGAVHLIDLDTGQVLPEHLRVYGPAISGVVAGQTAGRVVVLAVAADGTAEAWDPHTRRSLWKARLNDGVPLTAARWTEVDGRAAVLVGARDGGLRLIDPLSGRSIGRLPQVENARIRCVTSIARRDGPVGVTGGDDAQVRLWDLATGVPVGAAWHAGGGPVRAMAAVGYRGKPLLLTGADDGALNFWDPERYTMVGVPRQYHKSSIQGISAGSRVIASLALDEKVVIWTVDAGVVDDHADHAAGAVQVLDWAGRDVVAVAQGRSIVLVDARSGVIVASTGDLEKVCGWLAAGGHAGGFAAGVGRQILHFGAGTAGPLRAAHVTEYDDDPVAAASGPHGDLFVVATHDTVHLHRDPHTAPDSLVLHAQIDSVAFAEESLVLVGTDTGLVALDIVRE